MQPGETRAVVFTVMLGERPREKWTLRVSTPLTDEALTLAVRRRLGIGGVYVVAMSPRDGRLMLSGVVVGDYFVVPGAVHDSQITATGR